ncbi:TonB-dependent receptor plug domain-containing protein [Soonwooa sp.]|uniref:TonB-dependent receptor plug domain-containing protein n=2 Tax=Soonwooa sp. TaxID=1938592 RepID=UPI0028A20259|nr:TonB-dependent receptor plug domain-containing protein [Soonwooa sp.]
MKVKSLLTLGVSFASVGLMAQTGGISISLHDQFDNKPLSGKVRNLNTERVYEGVGSISIDSLQAKNYTFEIIAYDYQKSYLYDIDIVPNQKLSYSVGLTKLHATETSISEVVVTKRKYKTTPESPVSLRSITSEEIQKNAGSNRDVSRALLSLPGVATTTSFRNDLLIRGGSSMENKYYIDGIEVPTINHFQTQGASGGPRGIITVDFLKDVDFYSGAFPAKRNGVLSSLFEFNFRDARKEKLGYKFVLGIDDMQLMADGPLSKDQSWTGLFSVRRSNLQIMFKSIGLPFLPSYYDGQFKVSKKYKSGDELYFLGIGAIDDFKLNFNAKKTPENDALLDRLPISPQRNYTLGIGYRHLAQNGNWLFTLSRNWLDNKATKYFKNIEEPQNLILDYHSKELEHKLRIDRNWTMGSFKWSAGANLGLLNYYNHSVNRYISQNNINNDAYETDLSFMQYGFYAQTANKFFDNKLSVSAGIRLDAASYSKLTSNPLDQFSPRIAFNYKIDEHWGVSFNTGIYYQLPPFTALGFTINNSYVNKDNLKYIKNHQFVVGTEYNGDQNLRITLEGYYKKYSQYPFSLRNQVSLANLGASGSAVGLEPLDSRSKGEAYGLELLAQKRTDNDFYGIFAYTFGYSRFNDKNGKMLASSWDARHIASLTAGKYFGKNWNLSARFRMQSGFPETPYDTSRSSMVNIWNVANGPVYDYNLLNTGRGRLVHQLDVRAEKKWIFKKWQITGYVDVVNLYGSQSPSNLPVINIERDGNGNGIVSNPSAPIQDQTYELTYEKQDRQHVLPYMGIIVEF